MLIHLRSALLALAVIAPIAACSSSTTRPETDKDSGVSKDTDAGSGDDAGSDDETLAKGTYSGSGGDVASDSATVAGIQVSLAKFLATPAAYEGLDMEATNGDGTSSMKFSSPSGIDMYTFSSDVIFNEAPKAGQTYTESTSCGSTSISYGTDKQPYKYSLEASKKGSSCTTVLGDNAGSWTLTFSSVTSVSGGTGNFFIAHGTLTVAMPDSAGGTGTIKLTF